MQFLISAGLLITRLQNFPSYCRAGDLNLSPQLFAQFSPLSEGILTGVSSCLSTVFVQAIDHFAI